MKCSDASEDGGIPSRGSVSGHESSDRALVLGDNYLAPATDECEERGERGFGFVGSDCFGCRHDEMID